jgi:hypothetical protein
MSRESAVALMMVKGVSQRHEFLESKGNSASQQQLSKKIVEAQLVFLHEIEA